MLERSGYQTELDVNRLIESQIWLAGVMQRDLSGMLSRAGVFPKSPPRDKGNVNGPITREKIP
jgi:hypothetical protein